MLRYHEATKHSPASVAGSRHRLDWANQPLPFKVYRDLEPMPLPLSIEPSRKPALRSLRELLAVQSGAERIPSLEDVARLCILSNGITRVRRLAGGGEIAFRAAGTTGALYHVELYLVCRELPDLPAGVHHFGAHDNALRRLRAGDHRASLVEATGGEPSVARAPALIVATSTFWRNAWKYEARAWRHAFWDTGTVIANLLALAGGSDLPARVVVGFADDPVNELVGADGVSEAAVCLVALGTTPDGPPPAPPAAPLDLRTLPVSARDVRYPLIEEAQAASSLESGTAAAAWRSRFAALRDGAIDADAADRIRLPRLSDTRDEPIEAVIRRRGSTRRFSRAPIPREALGTLVECAAARVPTDFHPEGAALGRLHLIVNAVDGLAPGRYAVSGAADTVALDAQQAGTARDHAGWLALGQDLGADAAVNMYWLADLGAIVGELGDRGYRAAQLDAATRAGRAWLAAYAIGLGATGLTFFDDEVVRYFGADPERIGVMFLLAAGRPARRR